MVRPVRRARHRGQHPTARTAAWSSSNLQVATVNATTVCRHRRCPWQANITATVETKTGAHNDRDSSPTFGTVTGLVTAADGVTAIADAWSKWRAPSACRRPSVVAAAVSTVRHSMHVHAAERSDGTQVIVASRGAFQAKVSVNVRSTSPLPPQRPR